MHYETLYAPTLDEALVQAVEHFRVEPEVLEWHEDLPNDEPAVATDDESPTTTPPPTPDPAPTPVEEGMTAFRVRVKPEFWERSVRAWIEGFLEVFGLECGVEIETVGTQVFLRLSCSEPSILIGRQGFTLEALQHIVTRALTTQWPKFPEVVVDVESYREKKFQRLDRMAHSAAQRALRYGRPQDLEPMTASERKYIHNAVKDVEGIKTISYGREPNRHLVIEPLDATPRGEGEDAPRYERGDRDRRGRGEYGRGRDERPERAPGETATERRRLYTQFGERLAGDDASERPLGKITGSHPILPNDPRTPTASDDGTPEETLDWRPTFFKSPKVLPPANPSDSFPEVVDDLHE